MENVAQLVEPRFVVPVVVGSSPIVRPSFLWGVRFRHLFFYVFRQVGLKVQSVRQQKRPGRFSSRAMKLC